MQLATEETRQNGSDTLRGFYEHDIGMLDRVYSKLERLGRVKPGASQFQRWAACAGSLRRMESAENPDKQLIERAAGAVAGCSAASAVGGKASETDPLERLLAAYQKIAERKPGAAKDVIRAIDGRLLWLAPDSGKIDNVRRWERWADAVAALRFRGSNDLGRFVHKQMKNEKDADVRAALERAEKGLASR